ncbi:unnamed protein product, partial [Trichobilharzia regenti]
MPISIAYIILKVSWIPCHILCHLWIIADVYFCSTNMFNLVVIALDRMMAVNYAVKYNQMMSNTRVRLLILLIWILALFITLPLLINLLWNYTTATQNMLTIDTDYAYSYHIGSRCMKYPCSLINVSVYIRIFITIGAVYVPTILICYFYFHVFSKVVVNKRGISIGLLIDNESVCNKKSDKKCSTISKSTNAADTKISTDNPEKKNNTSDDQGDANNNNDNNNNNGNNNNNKSNAGNKRNYKSNCGLLRVHVGGRPFQTNHIS